MLLPNLCWADFRDSRSYPDDQPLLFLDRDGVVVEEVSYLHTVEETRIIAGFSEIVARANAIGWPVGLVTNQAGIGRGYYGWSDFFAVQQVLDSHLWEAGAHLDFVVACPFHADAVVPEYRHPDHPWRKPNAGMLQHVIEHFHAKPEVSILVGDQSTDVEAGVAAGLGTCVHVLTGHGRTNAFAARMALARVRKGLQVGSIDCDEMRCLVGAPSL